ncbi:MTH1187 family thiamine-binding protein [Candidatus Magnetaquicoccus inordinatus]|uniref:MTH1187 family thiamine-binding protein n=1 Tax=Candidatus Magnetaquicoccus inordinatus TaxID=2496818 RepID=UPI00102B34A8|nr:MTH1187 family thiamine-binding protein [Candidatus Magnetaquicoccus inordinatus]
MSVLLEFSMTPLDKGESVSTYVARSLDIIDQSGLPYKLGPMGTCLEGEWEQCMEVVKQCLTTMQTDCKRISIAMRIDYRQGKENRLVGKIASVEEKLGRSVRS